MFIGFSKRLKKMGGLRVGAGLRLTKKNAVYWWIAIIGIGVFYMVYWSIMACFWLVFGLFWVCGVSCRTVYRAIKNASARRAVERSAQASPRIEDKEQ